MTPDQIQEEIRAFCARMSEHVDAIQVLCSVHKVDETTMIDWGHGNHYARKAMCFDHAKRMTQRDQAYYIAEQITPSDEDYENWNSG